MILQVVKCQIGGEGTKTTTAAAADVGTWFNSLHQQLRVRSDAQDFTCLFSVSLFWNTRMEGRVFNGRLHRKILAHFKYPAQEYSIDFCNLVKAHSLPVH